MVHQEAELEAKRMARNRLLDSHETGNPIVTALVLLGLAWIAGLAALAVFWRDNR